MNLQVKPAAFLQRELDQCRHRSLIAARNDDFRKVAQLTMEAARLNHALMEKNAAEQASSRASASNENKSRALHSLTA
jgi:hypothetical protein